MCLPLHRAGLHAVRNGATAETRAAKLLAADDIVLAPPDPRNRLLRDLHDLSSDRAALSLGMSRIPHMRALARRGGAGRNVSLCR